MTPASIVTFLILSLTHTGILTTMAPPQTMTLAECQLTALKFNTVPQPPGEIPVFAVCWPLETWGL